MNPYSLKQTIALALLFICSLMFLTTSGFSQPVLFDFDNATVHSPLPIDLTVGGITAHFKGTGDNFSIQTANTMGFTPAGFAGLSLYPGGNNLSDLLIRFDQAITDFSIMYAAQELGCDNAETMRVTAFSGGVYVGTNTRVATFPGTWPSDTLMFSAAQGFDSVVVHYDSRPPTCTDYGTVFMADNMYVTPLVPTAVPPRQPGMPGGFKLFDVYPSPFNPSATIRFELPEAARVELAVYNALGQKVSVLLYRELPAGGRSVTWNAADNSSGIYYCRMNATTSAGKIFSQVKKLVLLR